MRISFIGAAEESTFPVEAGPTSVEGADLKVGPYKVGPTFM
jgi:hypothetical protein